MNSRAGELLVIGCHSNLPLYNQIRQKYCHECDIAEEEGVLYLPPEQHGKKVCYKNVDSKTSSKSMEPDMAFDAFSSSIETHGLVYLECVKDGDSDIEKTLKRVE